MNKMNYFSKILTSTLVVSLASGIYATNANNLQAQEIEPETTTEELTDEIEPETTTEELTDEVETNTTIEELTDEPSQSIGEQVSVRGEVAEVEPGVAFTIIEEGFFNDEEVIVINTSGAVLPDTSAYDDDIEIQVTGEVGQFIIADIERDYDVDLDDELYVEYEDKPVIFAESFALSPEIESINENPDIYFNQVIAVEGEIENVANNGVFTLEEDEFFGSDEILVINNSLDAIPVEGEKVVVTGVVRTLVVGEFERDYDLTWDLDLKEEIEAEYTQKPVLVIDAIYPSAED